MKIKNMNKKQLILLISLMLLCTMAVGMTLAYIVTQTSPVENIFTPSHVTCEVTEDFNEEKTLKENVAVMNTSDIEAYIRAAVVVTWQDEAGNISSVKPVSGVDYSITYNNSPGWIKGSDGYYYYSSPVAPDGYTDVLISECKPLKDGPQGYTLHVEIIAEAIQSVPADAVEQAWNVTVTDGSISNGI